MTRVSYRQLPKYAISEEIETLNQYSEEVHRMTKADKFFFEIAQIPRYEEKLKVIFYYVMIN